MKLFTLMKDGGAASRVWGYFLIEWKKCFSVVLLHFKDGTREAYHSHAFNAVSWVLWGQLTEKRVRHIPRSSISDNGEFFAFVTEERVYRPSLIPIYTSRDNLHQVASRKNTWVLSFRGPWVNFWRELVPTPRGGLREITLTHGRKEVPAT